MKKTAASGLALSADNLPVSKEFKKEAIRSVWAIAAFIIVYILLIVLSIALVVGCVYAGLAIIINIPKFITILIGAGLIGFGVMIFVFMIKFLFAKNEADHSDSIEINADDQPELVAFIHDIAAETGTSRPRRIYLSYEVNACVFYNSSFWSMFLPVRKNLKIGLGLVNAVNVSEFKAVIAHEFGHFSQRSMKVGSYVYHVNHIIYNMLFQNNNYASTLTAWAEVHYIFYIFALLTLKLVQGIQWVLRQMYTLVNKSYMALSRQMEFHADLVAAVTTGGNNIVSSLKRIELAADSFQSTVDTCNELWKEKLVVHDIYGCHRAVMKHVAAFHNLELKDGMPVISQDMEVQYTARINFKNQWASHPTLEDREAYLDPFQLVSEVNEMPAWTLFRNKEVLKQQLTEIIYNQVTADVQKSFMDISAFEDHYKQQVNRISYPKIYNGYYDNRQIEIFPIDDTISQLEPHDIGLPVPAGQAGIFRKIQQLENDLLLLTAIEQKQVDTKTFDFDGQKYNRRDAAVIRDSLEKERDEMQTTLAVMDKAMFRFAYAAAAEISIAHAIHFKEQYEDYFNLRREADSYFTVIDSLMKHMQPVYEGQTLTLEVIQEMIALLKDEKEPALKKALKQWQALGAFDSRPELQKKLEAFHSADFQYFAGNSFFDTELNTLHDIVISSWNDIQLFLKDQFRQLLELQETIVKKDRVKESVV